MKKIFTLFCALTLMLGTNVAQTAPKAFSAKKAQVAVEQMQEVQLEKAQLQQAQAGVALKSEGLLKPMQALNFNQLSAAPALTVNNQKASVVKSPKAMKAAKQVTRRTAATAKTAAKSTNTAITIGDFSASTYEGEYYVILTDAASTTQFIFDINTSANPFELGKTYTIADMVEGYTGISDAEDWYAWTIVTAASYTETKDEKGLTHVVASMTDEEGNVYDITYDQPEPQDIDVTAVDWYYDGEYYDVYLYSEEETYLFELNEGLELGKDYTYADMVPSWTCTLTSSGYPKITATDATLKVTKDEKDLVHIVATMVLNGDTHKITFDEKAFEPTGKQIDVNGTDLNGRYMSAYGFYLYTATWGDYTVQLAFDAEEEKASYTNEEFIANYGLIYSDDEDIQLFKLASDNITITNTETTKTLAGSVYAKNGDEYVLNLVYEKPDAKYIDINVANATLTNKCVAGFWKIDGQTADKNNSFGIYFISKALQGTFTNVEQFDSYSTWVSDKSSGSNVYYENLSEVNLTSVIDGDSLKITGTLNLADASGNPAIVTVYITTPFTQEWGEWADFAPFDKNTGKFVFSVMFTSPQTQVNIPVQVRKDNTGFKQYKFIGWGKGLFTTTGIDLLVDTDPNNVCTVSQQDLGLDPGYGENVQVQDFASKTGQNIPSTYDPETGVFKLALSYFISLGSFGADYETMTMDQVIAERDTVKVTADMKIAAEPDKDIIKVSAELNETTYILEVVGTDTIGTFSLADGTLSQKYYYGIVSAAGRFDFSEGGVTIAKTETGLELNGLMIGADEKAYVFDWTYAPITERDTVDIKSTALNYNDSYIESNGVVIYYASDVEGYSVFRVTSNNATSVDGTFSWADGTINDPNSYFQTTGSSTKKYFQDGEFTVVTNNKDIALTGWMIGTDEIFYRLDMSYTAPTTRDTVNFSGNGITISEVADQTTGKQTGWFYEVADATAGYEFLIQSTVASTKFGTFSYEDKTLGRNYYNIFTPSGERMQFTDGYITVTEQPDGSITLYGELIGEDEKVYVLNFVQAAGVLNYDTDAPFDATFAYSDMSASIDKGVIGIHATNEENLTIGLELYADAEATEIPAGTYVISDTQEAGTALKSQGVAGGYLTECWAGTRGTSGIEDCWFMIDGTITLSYDEYGKLNVAVDAKNSYDQSVTATITYTKVEPKDTVSMEGTFVVGEEYQASYGLYYYDIMSSDSLYNAVLFTETDEMTGDLASKIDFGDCAIYTYEGDELSIIDVYEFVVSAVGKKMQLTAKVLADNLTMYDITANCFYGAIDGDAQEAFTATYSTEEISDVFSSKAKMHVISACDEAGDSIHIVFKSSQDPLEARTYEITTSGSLNTVVASDGTATSLNAVSFAAKKNDGEIDKLWHMVSGTVTIDEAGNITVDALNSYDQKITININVPLPDYYLYNYNNGKYLGWNGASTDKNKISMMSEADRMPVAITLTDADNKRFTTAVTATDGKVMYLSMGTGFNFHSGSPYTGEQDNGYWYQVKDINASTIVADKVSEIVEGEYYIIVHNFNGYSALSGTVIDTDGNGKMRISGYKLASAGDELTFAYNDIKDCIYRYVTATTPAPEPRPTEEPVVEGNILDEESFNFNGGTVGNWLSAGTKTAEVSVVAPGYNNSAYAMKVTTATAGANHDTQVKYVGNYINGHTYSYSFKAKASENANIIVALQQDGGEYQGVYSMPISLTTEWAEFSGELTVNGDNIVRFLLNVGETAADYFFDQIVLIDETAKSVMPIMMNGEDMIFNTAGQRILNPVKGNVYIINGKQTLFE